MAQLAGAIDGIAEACSALGTPITGGNVSLYNETKGEAIYPTPVVGIVGILEDVRKAVPADFQRAGDAVLLLTIRAGVGGERLLEEFGSSEFAKTILEELWGCPPGLQLKEEAELHKCLAKLADAGLLHSARDVSDGGMAVALAEGCFANKVGVGASMQSGLPGDPAACTLFGERASEVILTCAPESVEKIKEIAGDYGFVTVVLLGETIADRVEISIDAEIVISEYIENLRRPWLRGLPDALEAAFHLEQPVAGKA
jgi:phosphoribosylformylglycinamidine synthase